MTKVSAYCRNWFAVFLAAMPLAGYSQLHTAGDHFVLSIPEDGTRIGKGNAASKIFLRILSVLDGTATLTAGDGTDTMFSFKAKKLCELVLPKRLMHTAAPGKAPIGISVRTSAPVNLVLHDVLDFAGEATQIFPVHCLGKEYIVPSWRLFNDSGEDNHAQITITPVDDATAVEIVSSVRTLNGIPPDSAVTIMLDRGESYILKADISTGRAGLSGTRLKASRPISVMTSVTCAYVPPGQQACNMLLDHLLPTEYMGTEFYASPLGASDREASLIFTSTAQNFSVSVSDGRTVTATRGQAIIDIMNPVHCQTSQPAFCHEVTPGTQVAFMSDPSIVTILPIQYYQDTLLWYTPPLVVNSMPFYHTVSVICLTSAAASVQLDGKALSSLAIATAIEGTDRTATQVMLAPGVHMLTSAEPIFAVASGFQVADAYSFLPMGIGSLPLDAAQNTDPKYDLGLTAHADPVAKTLSLDIIGTEADLELTIFNSLGNIVLTAKGSKKELRALDIASLPPGSYVLEVMSGLHRGRTKFIILPSKQ